MDPVSMIATALATGAAAGTTEVATQTVKDAAKHLHELVDHLFSTRPAARAALKEHQSSPEEWQPTLESFLRQSHADQNQAVLEAARTVLESVDPTGAQVGRYVIEISGSQGVQIGENNSQTNHFGSPDS